MDLLSSIAREALLKKGFLIDFQPDELDESQGLEAPVEKDLKDLRDLYWISIDNDDSLDLDQLTYAEGNRVYVAVADVDRLVKKGSLLDLHAAHNTTSIYTPTAVFPMLPILLSNNLTSLNPGEDRVAVVTEMEIDDQGRFHLKDVYRALVNNHEKLAYHQVDEWMKRGEIHYQIDIQDRLAQKIKAYRIRQGALQFKTVELVPIMRGNEAVHLEETEQNRAQELIENLMIGANSCMTHYFAQKKIPIFKRIVRVPKRWDRIQELAFEYGFNLPDSPDVKALQNFLAGQRGANPSHFPDLSLAVIKLVGRGEYVLAKPGSESPGHFDLALQEYAHTTAPNRRYPDLIMQRLLKGVTYTDEELTSLATHCTLKEDDAARAERRVMKSAYAMVLSKQIGQIFSALVTGVNENGIWVRVDNPAVEGKLVEGGKELDVGDRLQVKLLKTDVKKGFIDFKKVS